MTDYCLTAEEVLYLAAMAGADTFYGVPDMLSGLSDQELKWKVIEMENGLCKKGYLEEDFDGNKNIMPELVQIIDFCGRCERLLCFEKERIGEPQQAFVYFIKENSAYEMKYQKGQYFFSKTDFQRIRKEIKEEMTVRKIEKVLQNGFSVSFETLEKASRLIRRGAAEKGAELLKEAGAAETMAQVAVNGILSKAAYYALLFMDLRREETSGYSIQCLQGDMLISIEYEMKDDEDYARFSVVDDMELKKRVEVGLEMIDCLEEEAFT